jgi:hypothetical protein
LVVTAISKFTAKGLSIAEALRRLGKVPMQLDGEPWVGLLWDKTNQRMLTQPANQNVALSLLYHAAGGSLADLRTNLTELRKELAGILNRKISKTKIPIYL